MENNGNGVAFEHFPCLPVGETVRLYQLRYMLNNRLAVVAVRDGDTEGCPILLTANIPNAELSAPGRTFFDTRLHSSEYSWALHNHICKPTGRQVELDFCIYPEVEFDRDVLIEQTAQPDM